MSKNIFSNEAFASYCDRLGKQEYKYVDCENCGVAGYLRFCGFQDVLVGGDEWSSKNHEDINLMPKGWADILTGSPRTYEALAARLRALPNAI